MEKSVYICATHQCHKLLGVSDGRLPLPAVVAEEQRIAKAAPVLAHPTCPHHGLQQSLEMNQQDYQKA
jgi:hypothetical protein